jgi:DHA2 family multidrug resistance protein
VTSTAQAAEPAGGLTLRHLVILVTLTFVTILYSATVTIANVALPDIRGALSATQDQITWIVTANIVATAVATPLAGWMAGRFGVRRVILVSIAGFTLSSILCGSATSLGALVLYRVGQGAFGAPLVPLSQAYLLRVFPQHLHTSAMAIWGMGAILGPIIAPTIGGYLSEIYGWRWVFFMLVPFGVVAFLSVSLVITENTERVRVRLDWIGFLTLSVAITALQFMLDRGEGNNWFESWETIMEAGLAALAFYVFIAHSLTAKQPFLNPRLLLNRNYALGLLLALSFGMLNFTPMVMIPPMLQDLQGYPQSIVGLLLAMRGVGTLIGFTIMFFASKIDPRYPMTLGFILQAVAGMAMAQFDVNVTTFEVAWTSALQGLGVGFVWVPMAVVTFATMEPKSIPQASGIFHLLRNFGSSVYISMSVAIMLNGTKVNYAEMTEHISIYNETLRLPFVMGQWSSENLSGLAAISAEIQRQAMMIGYANSFYVFALTSIAVIPLVLMLRVPKQA